ncbi:STAS domain-containing protein [Shewanella canadensis]|uniref:STAS domain-containing protein n=1 Tax=Shewanella canadensis TaxID=271096 RepID=A0A431WRC2_9GAMM|nr:STAS domain-containing protein [Shewanella canadensis]RTR38172.1 STAS domain-containing protein [Shewanella canadensis]
MTDQTIKLDSELTIRNIQPIFARLSELLIHDKLLHVDVSQLSRVDTAGAQLLYLFSQTCNARSLKVEWQGGQPELRTNLESLGIVIPELQTETQEKML